MKTAAMLLAAGGSTRMGFPKQTATLLGLPVIAHTLTAFQQAASIRHIVIVARPEDHPELLRICRDLGIDKLYAVTAGGDTRQRSAQNGLAALPPDCDLLAVHDGARPLVTPALIDRVTAAAEQYGAAAAAVPVKDTIKAVGEDGFVTATPDRRTLRQVQTPQAFRLDVYRRLLADAANAGLDFTDDCQLFEHGGLPVFLVEGSYRNLKITTPEDLTIAAALL